MCLKSPTRSRYIRIASWARHGSLLVPTKLTAASVMQYLYLHPPCWTPYWQVLCVSCRGWRLPIPHLREGIAISNTTGYFIDTHIHTQQPIIITSMQLEGQAPMVDQTMPSLSPSQQVPIPKDDDMDGASIRQ